MQKHGLGGVEVVYHGGDMGVRDAGLLQCLGDGCGKFGVGAAEPEEQDGYRPAPV